MKPEVTHEISNLCYVLTLAGFSQIHNKARPWEEA
jgi:hypothetical protein